MKVKEEQDVRSLHGFAKAKVERSETVETAKNQNGKFWFWYLEN